MVEKCDAASADDTAGLQLELYAASSSTTHGA